jgi:hypothetical protein
MQSIECIQRISHIAPYSLAFRLLLIKFLQDSIKLRCNRPLRYYLLFQLYWLLLLTKTPPTYLVRYTPPVDLFRQSSWSFDKGFSASLLALPAFDWIVLIIAFLIPLEKFLHSWLYFKAHSSAPPLG